MASDFTRKKRNKLLRLGLEKLSKEENFDFVRSRIKAVRLFRHLLKSRHDQFQKLPTFAPLLRSIEGLDRTLEECELVLRRFAVGEIAVGELDTLIRDEILSALDDNVSDLRPVGDGDNQASEDAQMLMERTWDELIPHTQSLQDALQSVWDDESFALPEWRLRFEREEAKQLARKTSGHTVDLKS